MRPSQAPLPRWARLLLGLAPSGMSVVLLLLSQPPYGLWPLVFAGFIPMLLAQIAYLVYRTVENRVAAVKADTLYDSLVVDPTGWVVASHITPAGGQSVLVADVPLGTANAPQRFLGDTLGWFSLAGLLFFSLPNPLLRRTSAAQPASL